MPFVQESLIRSSSDSNGIHCPKCKGYHLQSITETDTSVNTKSAYSGSKGCLGFLLLGPIGLLCGNGGKQTSTVQTSSKLFWVCSDCGHKFRNLDDWAKEIDATEKSIPAIKISAIVLAVLGMLSFMVGWSILGISFIAVAVVFGIMIPITMKQVEQERANWSILRNETKD